MKIKAEVSVEINGEEVYRGPSKSFVQNFAKMLVAVLKGPAYAASFDMGAKSSTSLVDINGSSVTAYAEWYADYGSDLTRGGGVQMALNAPDNDDSFGICVGSGSTPVSITDYKLSSKIPHGTGSGQLDYETHTVASSYSDTYSYIEIARSFVNRSGADVVVREVGLVARTYWKDVSGIAQDIKWLIARDVLTTPILVPNLASLTVRYRISLSL